jgi:co-chaperonin GroES (HSP10)
MSLDIKPAFDILIVKELAPEDKLPSGLIVPQQVIDKDTLVKAEVLKAGPGALDRMGKLMENPFKVGDIVVFDKQRSLPMTYCGNKYTLVNATNVIGSLEMELN